MNDYAQYEGSVYLDKSSGRWRAMYEHPYTKRRRNTSGATKDEAIHNRREKLRILLDGGTDENPTLTVWVDTWSTWKQSRVREYTFKSYKSLIQNHIIPYLGSKKLKEITPLDIDYMLNDLSRPNRNPKPLSPKTRIHLRNITSSILDYAIKKRILSFNAARASDPPIPKTTRERRALTPEEMTAVLETSKRTQWHLPILIALTTGMRASEIIGLRWDDVDLEREVITVEGQLLRLDGQWKRVPPKTPASSRTIPIPPRLLHALKQHRLKTKQEIGIASAMNLVLAGKNDTPLHRDSMGRGFQRILKRCDIPIITFHELRHTYSTRLKDAGVDDYTRMRLMGHTLLSQTLDYTHFTEAQLNEARSQLDNVEHLF